MRRDPPPRGTDRPLRTLRHRSRRERFLHDAQDLLARPFDGGHEAAELQARELDAAARPDGPETEVAEEIAREDRLVHVEALERRDLLGIAIRERLERACPLVARVADRCEEERLHHP